MGDIDREAENILNDIESETERHGPVHATVEHMPWNREVWKPDSEISQPQLS